MPGISLYLHVASSTNIIDNLKHNQQPMKVTSPNTPPIPTPKDYVVSTLET